MAGVVYAKAIILNSLLNSVLAKQTIMNSQIGLSQNKERINHLKTCFNFSLGRAGISWP